MLIGIMAAVIIYWLVVWALSYIARKLEDFCERMQTALMDELDENGDGEQKEEEKV